MTNPNDLIRRGDALYALHNDVGLGTANPAYECINAIPAAPDTPEVLALVEALRGLLQVTDGVPMFGFEASRRGDAARAAIAAWEASHDR